MFIRHVPNQKKLKVNEFNVFCLQLTQVQVHMQSHSVCVWSRVEFLSAKIRLHFHAVWTCLSWPGATFNLAKTTTWLFAWHPRRAFSFSPRPPCLATWVQSTVPPLFLYLQDRLTAFSWSNSFSIIVSLELHTVCHSLMSFWCFSSVSACQK